MRLLSVLILAASMLFGATSCGSKAKPDATAKDFMAKRAKGDIAGAKALSTASLQATLDLDAAMMAAYPDSVKKRIAEDTWSVEGNATESGSTASVTMKAKNSGETKTLSLSKEGDKWLVSGMQ